MIRPELGRECGCKAVGRWGQSWTMSFRIPLAPAVAVVVVVEEPGMERATERLPVQVKLTVPRVLPPSWVLAKPHPEQVHTPKLGLQIKYG